MSFKVSTPARSTVFSRHRRSLAAIAGLLWSSPRDRPGRSGTYLLSLGAVLAGIFNPSWPWAALPFRPTVPARPRAGT
jgi:hypothetical protein